MSSLKEFRCEICGITSDDPIHWFVIECGDSKLSVLRWDLAAAERHGARHFCGEAHAQVYISRWSSANIIAWIGMEVCEGGHGTIVRFPRRREGGSGGGP